MAVRRPTLNAEWTSPFTERVERLGDTVQFGSDHNHWWLLTDLDTTYSGRDGRAFVSAYYLSRWGNDVAKDNNGVTIPTC